jgi:hypothetical protein
MVSNQTISKPEPRFSRISLAALLPRTQGRGRTAMRLGLSNQLSKVH